MGVKRKTKEERSTTEAESVLVGELNVARELEAKALADYHRMQGRREFLEALMASGTGDVVKRVG